MIEFVEVKPKGKREKAIIWLHGLGDSGHGWAGITDELNLDDLNIHYLFPHAPSIPVTINGGMVMPAWYDIYEMTLARKIDQQQIEQSAKDIQTMIKQLIEQGLKSEDIMLVGFSQGGAVVYEAGLSFDQPLAGIAALSTYYATSDSIQRHEANQQTAILIQHGKQDPVVAPVLAEQAQQTLQAQQYQTQSMTYDMAHTVCPAQITDLTQWIRQQFQGK